MRSRPAYAGVLISLLLVATAACHAQAPAAPPPVEAPLHLVPLSDLVPAGGLEWIVDARPRELLASPQWIAGVAAMLPPGGLDAFARTKGVDLRSMDQLVVAEYERSRLFLAHEVVEPAKLEAAFNARVAEVQGRFVDRISTDPRGVVTRLAGATGTEHEALVTFGVEGAGFVHGDDAPLRAAEFFAAGKLRRAQPAWRAKPLDAIANLLGDAPLRAAAPGPFTGDWERGLGGVVGAATGGGAALWAEGDVVRIKLVVTGPWGDRAAEAAEHLRAAYDTLQKSGLGRLMGLHQPLSPPNFTAKPDVLGMDVSLDALVFLRGIGDATSSKLHDILHLETTPTRDAR